MYWEVCCCENFLYLRNPRMSKNKQKDERPPKSKLVKLNYKVNNEIVNQNESLFYNFFLVDCEINLQ